MYRKKHIFDRWCKDLLTMGMSTFLLIQLEKWELLEKCTCRPWLGTKKSSFIPSTMTHDDHDIAPPSRNLMLQWRSIYKVLWGQRRKNLEEKNSCLVPLLRHFFLFLLFFLLLFSLPPLSFLLLLYLEGRNCIILFDVHQEVYSTSVHR